MRNKKVYFFFHQRYPSEPWGALFQSTLSFDGRKDLEPYTCGGKSAFLLGPLWVTYWVLIDNIIMLEIVAKLLRTWYHVYLNTRLINKIN